MWGKKNTDSMSALDESAKHETAWLGSGLQVKGEITGTEDLQIDGAVEGLIHLDEQADGGGDGEGDGGRQRARRGGVRLPERKRAREGTDRDQEGWCDHREFEDGADPDRRRRGLQRFDRNRQERNGAGGEECRLAGGSGWRGVERHLTIRDGGRRRRFRCKSGHVAPGFFQNSC